jgi:hypothetical protein
VFLWIGEWDWICFVGWEENGDSFMLWICEETKVVTRKQTFHWGSLISTSKLHSERGEK